MSSTNLADKISCPAIEEMDVGPALAHYLAAVKSLEPEPDMATTTANSSAQQLLEKLQSPAAASSLDAVKRQKLILHAKLSLYAAWQSDILSRISQTHPDVGEALSEMNETHRSLFGFLDLSEDVSVFPEEKDILDLSQYDEEADSRARLSHQITPSATWKTRLKDFFRATPSAWIPAIEWLPKYPWLRSASDCIVDPPPTSPTATRGALTSLRRDAVAGITTGVMMIPQTMAYGLLAGVSPLGGLYSGFIGSLFYPLFGTSKQTSVGPLALVSLLTFSAINATDAETPSEKLAAAMCLSLLVGLILLVMGILRLGFITNFISEPVLSGFTSAAAVLITVSQLHPMFGIPATRQKYAFQTFIDFCSHIGLTHWPTLLLTLGAISILVSMKIFTPSLPSALVAVVTSIAISWPLDLEAHAGISVVGDIPRGLPPFHSPNMYYALELLPNAGLIALIGYAETIAVVKMWAKKCGYAADTTQELVAHGLCNTMISMFGGIPAAASLSRSAVNANAGARSTISSLICALLVMFTLLWLTPLMYHLPKCILACIIVVAMLSLVDIHEPRRLWRISKIDFVMLLLAFVVSICSSIEIGLVTAVGVSLVLTIFRASRPNSCVLGQMPGSVVYRDVGTFNDAKRVPGIVVFCFDGPIYFGNSAFLREELARMQSIAISEKTNTRCALIVDCTSISSIDATGIHVWHDVINECEMKKIVLMFAGMDGNAWDSFKNADLHTMVGEEHFTLRVHDAVVAVLSGKISINPILRAPAKPTVAERCCMKCRHGCMCSCLRRRAPETTLLLDQRALESSQTYGTINDEQV